VSTICRNRAVDTIRRRGRRAGEPLDEDALTEVADRYDASDSALGSLGTRWAMDLILELPRTEAEAVLLRAVIGLDAASAGQVLGKRPGAVRVAAHRGLRRLARKLEEDRGKAGGEDA
jgi:RNA polymerase sigma-70 factor (ECF subfamily)